MGCTGDKIYYTASTLDIEHILLWCIFISPIEHQLTQPVVLHSNLSDNPSLVSVCISGFHGLESSTCASRILHMVNMVISVIKTISLSILKVKIGVCYSPDIPVGTADFTLITSRYWNSFSCSLISLVRMQSNFCS